MCRLVVVFFSFSFLCEAQIKSAGLSLSEGLVELERPVKEQCVWTLKIRTPSLPVSLRKGNPMPSRGAG